MEWLNNWLTDLAGTSGIVIVGVILGLMMCFDLGGPVNKVAYAFAVAGLAAGIGREPDAVPHHGGRHVRRHGAAARDGARLDGARPQPLHAGRARERRGRVAARCIVHPRGCDPVRRGRPAARHPGLDGRRRGHRCAEHGRSGSQSLAPHGGIFVLFAINPIWGFLVALVAGVVVTALLRRRLQALHRAEGARRRPRRTSRSPLFRPNPPTGMPNAECWSQPSSTKGK